MPTRSPTARTHRDKRSSSNSSSTASCPRWETFLSANDRLIRHFDAKKRDPRGPDFFMLDLACAKRRRSQRVGSTALRLADDFDERAERRRIRAPSQAQYGSLDGGRDDRLLTPQFAGRQVGHV